MVYIHSYYLLQDANLNRPLFECTRCSHSSGSFDDLTHHVSVHDELPLTTATQQQTASKSQSGHANRDHVERQPAVVLLSSDSEYDDDDDDDFQADLGDSQDEECIIIDWL